MTLSLTDCLIGIISMIGFVGGSKDKEGGSASLAPLSGVFTVRGILVGSRDMMEDMNRVRHCPRAVRDVANSVPSVSR